MLGTQTTAMVLTARGPEQRSKEMTGRSQLIRYVYHCIGTPSRSRSARSLHETLQPSA